VSTANNILFMSGWAGYPGLFPRLHPSACFIHPFVSHTHKSVCKLLTGKKWDVLMAWSLGAHICLDVLPDIKADSIFLIAPFLSFTRYNPASRVHSMLSGLEKNPEATLRWFWRRCAVRNMPSCTSSDFIGLAQGLRYLLNSRIDSLKNPRRSTVTLIHGRKDRIVPEQAVLEVRRNLSRSLFISLPEGHFIALEKIDQKVYEQTGTKIL